MKTGLVGSLLAVLAALPAAWCQASAQWPATNWPGKGIPITHRYKYRLAWTDGSGKADIITQTSVIEMTITKKLVCDSAARAATLRAAPSPKAGNGTAKAKAQQGTTKRKRQVDVDTCSAGALQKQVSDIANTFVGKLQDLGENFMGLSTTGMSLSINEEYVDGKSTFAGYTSTMRLTVYVNTAVVPETLDYALDAGVTDISGVDFFISDDQLAVAQLEGIQLAVKDCYRQAGIAVDALQEGMALAEPLRVDIATMGQAPYVSTPVSLTDSATIDPDAENPIIAGRKTVEYRVKLRLVYGPEA